MTLIREKDERDGYIYDAAIKGADTTFWAEVIGTLAVDTTEVARTVRVNADRLHSFLQHVYGEYEFAVNQPDSPAATTNRSWGLRNPKEDTAATNADTNLPGGGVYFSVDTAARFQAISYDDFGHREATTLGWDTSYESAQNRFQINWEAGHIQFLINDVVAATHVTRVPDNPKSLELRNAGASNMDVAYVKVARAGAII